MVLSDAGGEHEGVEPAERGDEAARLARDSPAEKLYRFFGLGAAVVRQRAHVTGDSRHAQQSRLAVEQVLDIRRGHAELCLEMKHNTRIDGAAACSHHQPVECGEAHGGVDAFAIAHRAQAGAIAEMRRDHPTGGKHGIDLAQAPGDIFVRQTVESVAPDALLMEGAREGQARGDRRLVVVKRRVETGHLRKARAELRNRTDGGQIVRLVQRGERVELFQCIKDCVVDETRCGELGPAVDDTVANRDHLAIAQTFRRPSEDVL